MAETAVSAQAEAGSGVLVTGHACDVADETQLLRFRDELLEAHAGITSTWSSPTPASAAAAASWTVTGRVGAHFAIDWQGVYYTARVFVPLWWPGEGSG